MEEEFSFFIGKPWEPDNPNSSIKTYAYGSTVFHGTLNEAKNTKKFIEERAEDGEYFIYKLIKQEL